MVFTSRLSHFESDRLGCCQLKKLYYYNEYLSFIFIPLIVQTDMGTALHEAALYGKLDVVKVLLERGTV